MVMSARQLSLLHEAIVEMRLLRRLSPAAADGLHHCLERFQASADIDSDQSSPFGRHHPLHRPARLLLELWTIGTDLPLWMHSLAGRAQRPCPRLAHQIEVSAADLGLSLDDPDAVETELFWSGADPADSDWTTRLSLLAG
jgi:hypothetical protein